MWLCLAIRLDNDALPKWTLDYPPRRATDHLFLPHLVSCGMDVETVRPASICYTIENSVKEHFLKNHVVAGFSDYHRTILFKMARFPQEFRYITTTFGR